MSTEALRAAVPSIEVDGVTDHRLAGLLVSFSAEETPDGLGHAELVLHNAGQAGGGPGWLFFDGDGPTHGTHLVVRFGAGDSAGTVFDGRVTSVRAEFPADGTPRLGLLAEDRLQDLRMTRRTRTFEQMSDQDVVRAVAADHGLTPEIDLPGPTHRLLAQLNQSDLAFLRERAARVGGEVTVDGDTLTVAPRSDRAGDSRVLSYRQNLRELTVSADLAHQRTSLTVSGWDVMAKEPIAATSTGTTLAAELDGRASGASVLTETFGDRPDQVSDLAPVSGEEAQAYADAAFARLARRFVRGEALVEGDARLRVGSTVELAGVGPRFSGAYTVVRTRHLFDQGLGFRTRLTLERPGVGR